MLATDIDKLHPLEGRVDVLAEKSRDVAFGTKFVLEYMPFKPSICHALKAQVVDGLGNGGGADSSDHHHRFFAGISNRHGCRTDQLPDLLTVGIAGDNPKA